MPMVHEGLGSELTKADWSSGPQIMRLLSPHVWKAGMILTAHGSCELENIACVTHLAAFCEAALPLLALVPFPFWLAGLHQGFFSPQGALWWQDTDRTSCSREKPGGVCSTPSHSWASQWWEQFQNVLIFFTPATSLLHLSIWDYWSSYFTHVPFLPTLQISGAQFLLLHLCDQFSWVLPGFSSQENAPAFLVQTPLLWPGCFPGSSLWVLFPSDLPDQTLLFSDFKALFDRMFFQLLH